MFKGYYECDSHVRGHKSIDARDACERRRRARADRAERRRLDTEKRIANRRAEPEYQYVRRAYGRDGLDPVRIAKRLREEYPPRDDGRAWDWALVVDAYAKQLKWPAPGAFLKFLKDNPDVMLPTELLRKAGVSVGAFDYHGEESSEG